MANHQKPSLLAFPRDAIPAKAGQAGQQNSDSVDRTTEFQLCSFIPQNGIGIPFAHLETKNGEQTTHHSLINFSLLIIDYRRI